MKSIPLALVILLSIISVGVAQTTCAGVTDADATAAIASMRTELVDAFNKGDVDRLISHLDPDIVITWQNGEVSRGPDGVKAYYNKMMTGENKIVQKLSAEPTVDDRHIYGDWAVSWGNLHDEYTLNDGKTFKFDSRFTATIAKRGAEWKVVAFHASVNAFDNPILRTAASKIGTWAGIIGGVIGLFIGFIVGRLRGKRRRRAGDVMISEADLLERTRRDGIDAATEFLYRHVRDQHAHFVERLTPSLLAGEFSTRGEGERVQTSHALDSPARNVEHETSLHVSPLTLTLSRKGRGDQTEIPRVVIIPGAFHREYAHTGADGARMIRLAESLGWPAERVPLPSLAPMAKNAEMILDFLSRQPDQPTILISLSKGSADLRNALERPDATGVLKNVRAWINLSGIVTPTPLIEWFRARPLRCCGVRLLLRLRNQRFAVLDELSRGDGAPLDRPFAIPPHIRVFHILGFPRIQDLSDAWAQRGHARLARLGPNDGGGNLLIDAFKLPGDIYPVWSADHYLRPATIDSLLLKIFRESATSTPIL